MNTALAIPGGSGPPLSLPPRDYSLRPYQDEAIAATFNWCARYEGHPLTILPTGAGKSLTMGEMARRVIENAPDSRVLVLAHRKELIEQNFRAVTRCVGWDRVGIYSAGLNRKDRRHPIIVAGIQSIGRKPYQLGAFDVVLVDECHLVPPADDTLYRKLIKALVLQRPAVRFIGLTATPYRLGTGLLHRGKGALFTDVAYEAPVSALIADGYLCPLISKATLTRLETRGVAIRGGDYAPGALATSVDVDEITQSIVEETVSLCADRGKILVFCAGVQHAEHVAAAFAAAGFPAAPVHGELGSEERAGRLRRFREGDLRVLTSMDVLTTGYDEPAIDAIVLLRPTKSVGLYVQMVGRGLRLHPSKTNTLVLDFAGVVAMHGPIDRIEVVDKAPGSGDGEAPTKECPGCNSIIFAGLAECPDCGHAFPPPERPPLLPTASIAPILSTESVPPTWEDVTDVTYDRWEPRDPTKTPTMRVTYWSGHATVASEWVCPEHEGFARRKFEDWWALRCDVPTPATIEEALELTDHLATPRAIALVPDGKYTRITDYRWVAQARACVECEHYAGKGRCARWGLAEIPPDWLEKGCDEFEEALPF